MKDKTTAKLLIVLMTIIFLGLGFLLVFSDIFWGYIFILIGGYIAISPIRVYFRDKKINNEIKQKQEEAKIINAKKQAKIAQINQEVTEGKWDFPVEEFYLLCCENNATVLNNEFSIRKATQIAEQVIKKASSDIDLANCTEYLKKESLEAFLNKGQRLAQKAKEREILAQKQPQNANPNEQEMTFIKRASELVSLSGCNKRVKMLSNLLDDYDRQIQAMCEREEALKSMSHFYLSQQQKEPSWAIMGGIAEGIAGPAAGIMAASETIANNTKIREHNAAMQQASKSALGGTIDLSFQKRDLEEKRAHIYQQLEKAREKIILSKPTKEEIWKNINMGKATVVKAPSGVLHVSMPISLKAAFELDAPDNVKLCVDGVICAEVWFDDTLVDSVYFPLPLHGIPHKRTWEITLEGMCNKSVEYNGEYTIRIADRQNLWVMEA